jgi:hypothetical protein
MFTLAGAVLVYHLRSSYSFSIPQVLTIVGLLVVLVAPVAAHSLRPPPRLLTPGPRGLATPPDLELLAVAVILTLFIPLPLAAIVPWRWTWWSIGGVAVLSQQLGQRWYYALRWSGVRLEAGGVRCRQVRTVLLPWDSHPRLVVDGKAVLTLQPGDKRIKRTVDPAYLAAAIAEYAANPGRRAALGTTEEFTRLTAALAAPGTGQ